MLRYDAFISYSHAKDKPIAAALQSVVQKLGKPWYRRRALRVFRDDTSLSATPGLWPTIEQALAQARYLILLASPEAAASPWVGKEVAFWLAHKGADTLLIAMTSGELSWGEEQSDFARRDPMPLPAVLAGRFASEPRWVDLTAYRDGADPGDARFIENAADFAAAIRGMPKEDLLSQEVRQQRRALTLAWSAAGSLLLLAGLAGWQWKSAVDAERAAVEQREIAQRQRDRAVTAERAATEQKDVAQAQRERAERTLQAATKTSNTLVNDLAIEFRDRSGVPIGLVRNILDRAQALQRQLADAGESGPELRASEAAALNQVVFTLQQQGDTQGALAAAMRYREVADALVAFDPDNARWQRELSISYGRLGEALDETERREEALAAFHKSLGIREKLAAAAPDDHGAQRDLAIGHARMADVLMKTGQRDARAEALAAIGSSLALFEKLAAQSDPWRQHDLSRSYVQLAEALQKTGRRAEALQAHRSSLEIREKLAAADPANTQWQRDLATARIWAGMSEQEAGRHDKALEEFLKSVAGFEKLTNADPGNADWKRELSVGYEHIGETLAALERRDEALEMYRKSLAIREQLTAAEPTNSDWQHDLAVSHEKIGDMTRATERKEEALAAYRKSFAILQRLTHADPGNPIWQRALSVSYIKVGDMLDEAGMAADALVAYRDSLAIREKLAHSDPDDPSLQREITVAYSRIGNLLLASNRREEAVELFRKGLAISERLAAADPDATLWQTDVVIALYKLANAQDSPASRLARAVEILRRLDAAGKLSAGQKGWITDLEKRLAGLSR